MVELKYCKCVFGFEIGDPRDGTKVVKTLPSYLDRDALRKYMKNENATQIFAVREASVSMTFIYERMPGLAPLSEVEDVVSELPDSKDARIVISNERIIGYRCTNETCEKCPLLVDKDVHALLRARKKK